MLKSIFFLPLFISQFIFSQTKITGVVINGGDNSKLVAASIFINNSSIGTVTNKQGKFILSTRVKKVFDLVISYAGFETVVIKITPENIGQVQEVKMFPKKNELQEVSIAGADVNGWEKWGHLFLYSFIGTSDFAWQCVIKNPEVLRFFYTKKDSIVKAFSLGNLIIENKALGYIIHYQLEEFISNQKENTISYFGYTSFEDLIKSNGHKEKKWEQNRRVAYYGSLLHFMRSAYANTITEQGFEVHEKIRVYNKDSAFEQIYRNGNIPKIVVIDRSEYSATPFQENETDTLPKFIDLVNTQPFQIENIISLDTIKQVGTLYFSNYLKVTYNVKGRKDYLNRHFFSAQTSPFAISEVSLLNDTPVVIEKNGAYYDPLNIMSTGYWGWCKMADTLPNDYEVK